MCSKTRFTIINKHNLFLPKTQKLLFFFLVHIEHFIQTYKVLLKLVQVQSGATKMHSTSDYVT